MKKLDLTSGPIPQTVLRFSLPFLLSYFLQTLYGMADLYIIGRYCGVESTTAVAIGSQVMHMVTVMIVGLAMGSVVVIGRAVGAADQRQIFTAVGNTVFLFAMLSLGATLGLVLLCGPVIRAMSTPAAAVSGTAAYLRICFLGIPLITAYNVISSVLRGMGDSRTPMYFVAAACAANIALDDLLIGFFGMGPAGAALGTTLAQAFSVVLALVVLRRRMPKFAGTTRFRPNREVLSGILKIGVPVAMQDGFIQISFLVVTVFANMRGLEDAAAVGIVEKLIGLLFLVPSAMLQTVSTMAAQNIGAGNHRRVRGILRFCCGLCVGWGLLAVLLMHVGSERVIGCFSDDPLTVRLGCQYMSSYVWDCVFAGIHFCFSGYFCAYGVSGLSFLHNVISIVLVRIPFSYFAARYFVASLVPMGLASTAGSVLSVLICLVADRMLQRRRGLGFYGAGAAVPGCRLERK